MSRPVHSLAQSPRSSTSSRAARPALRTSLALCAGALCALGLLTPACGVSGTAQGGHSLILMNFLNDGVDNSVLNSRLTFEFSDGVDPSTISEASIQIREGGAFGKTVKGLFTTVGNTVVFEPQLAGLCDHSDSGLKPDTQYRVQAIGFPEEFAIRNMAGRPLDSTHTYEFHTREETDPNLYEDQIPGVGPSVSAASTQPLNGSEAVTVAAGNKIVLPVSENLDPCTVDATTVLLHMYAIGGLNINATAPNGNTSGFSSDGTNGGSTADQTPGNPLTWGGIGNNVLPVPQRILAQIQLIQSFTGTRIEITPNSGKFPENALLVVRLTFEVQDYGGEPLTPFTMAFTTQNLGVQSSTYVVENEGETPWNDPLSTADIDTARAPSRVQGYMLFAGDGDNGGNLLLPSLPEVPMACIGDRQVNDGSQDDFDPGADVLLDTGSTVNTCVNKTDGSLAVIWEFATMHIRNGITVRVVGKNAAIFLVQGDVLIENGGVLKGRGSSGGDNGQGGSGGGYQGSNGQGLTDIAGGKGVAGGGDGGLCEDANQDHRFSDDGNAGLGSPNYDATMPRRSPDTSGNPAAPVGGGSSGQPSGATTSSPWDGSSAGGGGGGHSEAGNDGETNDFGTNYLLKLVKRSFKGAAYERVGNTGGKMQLPEAGSGGGSAGFQNARTFNTSTAYIATGGAGGAGGGFLDLTSSGDINIFGTLDVAGGAGGDGYGWSSYNRSAGGGGGSGGGTRLLTPNDITLTSTAVVTAAGGPGGMGVAPTAPTTGQNDGGAGGNGRIVMESSNGVITGLGAATVIPGEGATGFYRGPFDATRFKGGGLTPRALSDLFAVGVFNPTFQNPIQSYGGQEDFIAGIPTGSSQGAGKTAMLIEAQGFQMKADGTADTATGTGWFTVGHFTDSGVDNLPTWVSGQPSGFQLPSGPPADNAGFGIGNLSGSEYVQLRVTIYLATGVGPFDPGAFLDRWTIRFTHNQ